MAVNVGLHESYWTGTSKELSLDKEEGTIREGDFVYVDGDGLITADPKKGKDIAGYVMQILPAGIQINTSRIAKIRKGERVVDTMEKLFSGETMNRCVCSSCEEQRGVAREEIMKIVEEFEDGRWNKTFEPTPTNIVEWVRERTSLNKAIIRRSLEELTLGKGFSRGG